MLKNVNHIYKYTAISNNTICLLYVINKRVAQLVFKIILRCEKLAWYTNLWITDFRIVVLSQNISFLNTSNLNSPLLMNNTVTILKHLLAKVINRPTPTS